MIGWDDGVLSVKTKVLILLAIDASSGDFEGVRSFFRGAKEVGASEEEILEVVEVVGTICGGSGLVWVRRLRHWRIRS